MGRHRPAPDPSALIRQWAHERRGAPALHEMRVGSVETVSYVELAEEVARVAALLRAQGVGEGVRTALWGPNGIAWVVAALAVRWAGGVLVPLDSHLPRSLACRIAQTLGVRVSIESELVAGGAASRVLCLESLRRRAQAETPLEPVDLSPSSPLLIAITSGTSGTPSGVRLSARAVLANAQAALTRFRLGPHTRLVSVLPLSHMYEYTAGLWVPLMAGGQVVYPRAPVATSLFDALASGPTTQMVVVPRLLDTLRTALLRQLKRRRLDRAFTTLRCVARLCPLSVRRLLFAPIVRRFGRTFEYFVVGGAPLPLDLAAFWEEVGIPVYEGYGLTECAPIVAANAPHISRRGTVGTPLPGVQVRIDEEGELWVRGPNLMDGYEGAAGSARIENGWLATGDTATIEEGGFVRIVGRKKEIIVTKGGFNVTPHDVEERFRAYESLIEEVCVVGCPTQGGEEPVAVVRSKGGDEELARMIEEINASLPAPGRIRRWVRWDGDFPRTHTQKVKRTAVAQTVCARQSAAVNANSRVPDLIALARWACGKALPSSAEDVTLADFLADNPWWWWRFVRGLEHLAYYTPHPEHLAPTTTLGELAHTAFQKRPPLRRIRPPSFLPWTRRLVGRVRGVMVMEEADRGAQAWRKAQRLTPSCCVSRVTHQWLEQQQPHPAILRELVRRRKEGLVVLLPPRGHARAALATWATLIAHHTHLPLWRLVCSEAGHLLASEPLSIEHDLAPPSWWRHVID